MILQSCIILTNSSTEFVDPTRVNDDITSTKFVFSFKWSIPHFQKLTTSRGANSERSILHLHYRTLSRSGMTIITLYMFCIQKPIVAIITLTWIGFSYRPSSIKIPDVRSLCEEKELCCHTYLRPPNFPEYYLNRLFINASLIIEQKNIFKISFVRSKINNTLQYKKVRFHIVIFVRFKSLWANYK